MLIKSTSWLELKPDETPFGYKEDFEEYYQRIQKNEKLKHIPKEVLEHWIYDQYEFDVTIKNYAWLDFYEMKFEKIEWRKENFIGIEIVEFYRSYVQEKSETEKIEDFQYDEYWKKNGTWFIPPIVFDVSSLKKITPQFRSIKGSYQFVDGHTRLGYLYALINISMKEETNLADRHWVFLMQPK